eukprot:scaffold23492_cov17-Tisochrysis_lutea.AAC.2
MPLHQWCKNGWYPPLTKAQPTSDGSNDSHPHRAYAGTWSKRQKKCCKPMVLSLVRNILTNEAGCVLDEDRVDRSHFCVPCSSQIPCKKAKSKGINVLANHTCESMRQACALSGGGAVMSELSQKALRM